MSTNPVSLDPADQYDLRTAKVYASPLDIIAWPVTRRITQLTMQPSSSEAPGLGFSFDTPLPENWKFFPTGHPEDGNWQYTVWAAAVVNGVIAAAGFIQMWQGRPNTGAPILSDFHTNWAYAARWGELNHYIPQPGDQMAFFISAGNARDQAGVTTVRERSNVVLVTLPAGDQGVFTFAGQSEPTPTPVPVPDPAPAPTPAPTPSSFEFELALFNKKLDTIHDDLAADTLAILARIDRAEQQFKTAVAALPTLLKLFAK